MAKVLAEVELARLLVDASVSGADELTVTILGNAVTMASGKGASHAQVAMARQQAEANLAKTQQTHKNELDLIKAKNVSNLLVYHVEKAQGHPGDCKCSHCTFLNSYN